KYIGDCSSDVCSADLDHESPIQRLGFHDQHANHERICEHENKGPPAELQPPQRSGRPQQYRRTLACRGRVPRLHLSSRRNTSRHRMFRDLPIRVFAGIDVSARKFSRSSHRTKSELSAGAPSSCSLRRWGFLKAPRNLLYFCSPLCPGSRRVTNKLQITSFAL